MQTVRQTSEEYSPLLMQCECMELTGEAIFSAQARSKGGKDSFRGKTGEKGPKSVRVPSCSVSKSLRLFALDFGNISKRKH